MFSSGQAHAELPDEERVGEPLGFQRSDWLCLTGGPEWSRRHSGRPRALGPQAPPARQTGAPEVQKERMGPLGQPGPLR